MTTRWISFVVKEGRKETINYNTIEGSTYNSLYCRFFCSRFDSDFILYNGPHSLHREVLDFLNSLAAAEVVRTIEMIPAAVKFAPLGFQYLNSLLCFLDADNSLSK